MTPADTPRTERYHLRSCEVNSAYAPNTPRELIGTKMCDCGLDKAIDAYATDRVEQAVVEALESIVSRHYAEDFGTYDFDGIAEDVLEALTPPPTNGEETTKLYDAVVYKDEFLKAQGKYVGDLRATQRRFKAQDKEAV